MPAGLLEPFPYKFVSGVKKVDRLTYQYALWIHKTNKKWQKIYFIKKVLILLVSAFFGCIEADIIFM